MPQQITLSPEHLATLERPDFCPRCFKIKHALNERSPLARDIPGKGPIDLLLIRCITEHVTDHGCMPPWAPDIGDVVALATLPNNSAFCLIDEKSGVKICGHLDVVLKLASDHLVIVCPRTGQPFGEEVAPDPLDEIELNCWAAYAQSQGLGEIDGLAILTAYALPPGDGHQGYGKASGGNMTVKFEVKLNWVTQDQENIRQLCGQARVLLDAANLPEGRRGCQDCALLKQIRDLSVRRKRSEPMGTIEQRGWGRRRQHAQVGMRVWD